MKNEHIRICNRQQRFPNSSSFKKMKEMLLDTSLYTEKLHRFLYEKKLNLILFLISFCK